MNEHDFSTAVHGLMTHTGQPDPMDGDRVLAAARQARKRRQGTVVASGAAVAVAAVATTAVMLPLQGGDSPQRVPVSGSSDTPPPEPTLTPPPTKPAEPPPETAPPNSDEHERAARLLDTLTDLRPAGHAAPTDLRSEPDGSGDTFALRQFQAHFEGYSNGIAQYNYYADMPVAKDGGTGRLLVHVVPSRDGSADACELAQTFWETPDDCTVVEVDGKKVGVATQARDEADQFDQWATYQHPDGTVVHLAQAKLRVFAVGLKPLAEQPFTTRQLAELASDERFHLD